MTVKEVFQNRHSELRAGWRLLLFLILASAFGIPIIMAVVSPGTASGSVIRAGLMGSVILATYIMTKYVNRKPFRAVGFSLHTRSLKELGIGSLLGFVMMTAIFSVEFLAGFVEPTWHSLDFTRFADVMLSAVALFGTAAFLEEILFRGYLFQTLIQSLTFLPSTILMAVCFSISHAWNDHVTTLALINVGFASVWLSFAYMTTRSLWPPIGLHFGWNFSQSTVYGFPTSGIGVRNGSIIAVEQSGPEWLTGSSFGPEGGILATMALMGCTWYILKSKHFAVPKDVVTLDSPEDLLQSSHGAAS